LQSILELDDADLDQIEFSEDQSDSDEGKDDVLKHG
jgi:hypothetical protein